MENRVNNSDERERERERQCCSSSSITCDERTKLKTRFQMPSWTCVHNSNIVIGYRPVSLSWWQDFQTLFWWHNETGSIWTHLIGLLMFFMLFQDVCYEPPCSNMTTIDFILISIFFLGVFICLMQSTLYHLFCSHSFDVHKNFATLDYCGITTLIGCSYIPWIYYGFYNSFKLKLSYMIVAAITNILCGLFNCFDGAYKYRLIRTLLFLADGCIVVVPAVHWYILQVTYDPRPFSSIDFRPILMLVMQGVLYISGALIYLFKIPESLYSCPIFNVWFTSHQIFHLFVLSGALIYYHSLILIMKMRLTNPNCYYN